MQYTCSNMLNVASIPFVPKAITETQSLWCTVLYWLHYIVTCILQTWCVLYLSKPVGLLLIPFLTSPRFISPRALCTNSTDNKKALRPEKQQMKRPRFMRPGRQNLTRSYLQVVMKGLWVGVRWWSLMNPCHQTVIKMQLVLRASLTRSCQQATRRASFFVGVRNLRSSPFVGAKKHPLSLTKCRSLKIQAFTTFSTVLLFIYSQFCTCS